MIMKRSIPQTKAMAKMASEQSPQKNRKAAKVA